MYVIVDVFASALAVQFAEGQAIFALWVLAYTIYLALHMLH